MEVPPTLAQTPCVVGGKATGVADQAVADEVPPLMGDDSVVQRTAALGVAALHAQHNTAGGQRGAVRLRNHDGRNGHAGAEHARGHRRRRARHVIHDNHAHRTRLLRVQHLRGKLTGATVYEGDLAAQAGGVRQCDATVSRFCHDHLGREVKREWPELRTGGWIGEGHARCAGIYNTPVDEAVHLHARRRTVRRGEHVGVVGTAVVQRLGAHGVAPQTAPTKVVHLGIARGFVEARVIEPVVQPVGGVEQVDHRGGGLRLVGLGTESGIVRVVKHAWCRHTGAKIASQIVTTLALVSRIQAIRRRQVGVGVHVVPLRLRGTGRQPGIVLGERRVAQAHQVGGGQGRGIAIGRARGMGRAVAALGAGQRRVGPRRFGPYAVVMLVRGLVVAQQQASVVGSHHIGVGMLLAVLPHPHFHVVGAHQPLRQTEPYRLDARRLLQRGALGATHARRQRPPLVRAGVARRGRRGPLHLLGHAGIKAIVLQDAGYGVGGAQARGRRCLGHGRRRGTAQIATDGRGL